LPSAALSNEDWRFAKPQSVNTDAEALMSIRGDVPSALATAIARAVRRNPHDRFLTMGEFLRAVQAVENQLGESEGLAPARGQAGAFFELPERPPSFPYLLPQNADAARTAPSLHKPAAAPFEQRKSPFATRVAPSALPGDTSFDVEPPAVRRKGDRWLFPAIAASVLVGTLTGAYFFSSPRSNESLASDARPALGAQVAEAAPSVSPANPPATATGHEAAPLPALPAALAESPKLTLARASEQQERYGEALKAYEEYAAANPNTAAANNIPARIASLRQFQTLLNHAKEALAASRFDEARAQYNEALKLRPQSRVAQAGVKESTSRIATPLTVPAISSPSEKRTNEENKESANPLESSKEKEPAPVSEEPGAKPETAPVPAKPATNSPKPVAPRNGAPPAAKPVNKSAAKIATALIGKP
jgi:hypothetical protein